jgi:hypothetical protein
MPLRVPLVMSMATAPPETANAAGADPGTPVLARDSCAYTACYCEENMYRLCERLASSSVPLQALYVVFISNVPKTVPLWCVGCVHSRSRSTHVALCAMWRCCARVLAVVKSRTTVPLIWSAESQQPVPVHPPRRWQRAGDQRSDGFVVWDYHVMVLEAPPSPAADCGSCARVWDLDTLLPFPCEFATYAEQALQVALSMQLPQQFHR